MYPVIQYALGTILLAIASYANSIPLAIQGLAVVIWASSENIRGDK